MKRSRLALAIALGVAIIMAGFRLGGQISAIWAAHRSERYRAPAQFVRGALGGVDPWGRRFLEPPPRARYVAPFVLHANHFRAQLALWESVSVELHNRTDIYPIGYCDSWQCAKEYFDGGIHSSIPVLQFGNYETMNQILRADDHGFCLILDQVNGHVHAFACQADLGTADELSAAINRIAEP